MDNHNRWSYKLSGLLAFILLLSLPLLFTVEAQAAVADFDWVSNDDLDGNGVTITAYHGSGGDIVIPATLGGRPVTRIGASAFDTKNISHVELPETLLQIGFRAFFNNKISELIFPDSLVYIDHLAFQSNELTSVVIPAGVTEINIGTFGHNRLNQVTLHEGITFISTGAFSYNNLTEITLPESLIETGFNTFSHNQLQEITIPRNLKEIRGDVFANNALTHVIIPDTVTHIGNNAFLNNNIARVEILGRDTRIESNAFSGNQANSKHLWVYGYPENAGQLARGRGYSFYNFEPTINFSTLGNDNWALTHSTSLSFDDNFEEVYYQWSSSPITPRWNGGISWMAVGRDTAINTPAETGAWYLHARVTDDYLGLEVRSSSEAFIIDQTPPIINITTTNHGSNATVNANIMDNVGVAESKWAPGIQALEWFTSNGEPFLASFTVIENGTYSVYARDQLGNAAIQTITINHISDIIPPADATFHPNVLTPTNQNVVVTIHYPDGVELREYKINGGSWHAYTAPIIMEENGIVFARSRATEENWSNETSITINNIDKVPPAISLGATPTQQTNGNVSIITAINDNVAIAERKWAFGEQSASWFANNGTAFGGSTITVEENGIYSVYARDTAGNETVATIQISQIVRQAPQLTISYTPHEWTNQDVIVNVAITNDFTVVERKWTAGHVAADYFLTEGIDFVNSFTVEENGDYTVYIRDVAGNERVDTITITHIDRVAPTLSLEAFPSVTGEYVTIVATIQDLQSGFYEPKWVYGEVDKAYFATGGRSFIGGFDATLNGIYTVYVRDAAGNETIEKITVTDIEREAPTVVLTVLPTAPTRGNVTVTAAVYSEYDLVVQKFALGQQDVAYFSGHGEIVSDGQYILTENGWVTFYVQDIAGNETVQSIEITNIDRERPVISLNGERVMTVRRGEAFVDPGATATDNIDGDISSEIIVTGHIDTSVANIYLLFYDVLDRAGNAAEQVVRIVHVNTQESAPPSHPTPPPSVTPPPLQNPPAPPSSPSLPPVQDPEHGSEGEKIGGQDELPEEPRQAFSDIAGHWAEAYIDQLVQRGAIAGFPDGTLRPDQSITRAEFIAILLRAFGVEAVEGQGFLDTEYHWARELIATAHTYGIISGYSNAVFGANDVITREQMAVIMRNLMDVLQLELESVAKASIYHDHAQMAAWSQEAVQWMTGLGIMQGYHDNSFKPKGSATRAEAITVIVRLLDKTEE